MNILSLLAATVFAAETVISPLPDHNSPQPIQAIRDAGSTSSFGSLLQIASPHPSLSPLATPTLQEAGPTAMPTTTPEPIVTQGIIGKTRKPHIVIALLGDSMVDTLGSGVPALQKILTKEYPGVSFTILNYGVGATNLDYGIERLTQGYDYLGSHIPSLVSINPNVVIIESFGYNPYALDLTTGLDKQWLALAKATDTIRTELPQARVMIASTIGPNASVFGDGAPGISLSASEKQERVRIIDAYLENALRFAQSQKLPYSDAYHASLDVNGQGVLRYINSNDHIHYSDAGRQLFSQKIANTITDIHLLE